VAQRKCEDGVCRPRCLAFYGCSLELPYRCPDGVCAQTLQDCPWRSPACRERDPERPFRCRNSDCVARISECPQQIGLFEEILVNFDATVALASNSSLPIGSIRTTYYEPIILGELEILEGSMEGYLGFSDKILNVRGISDSLMQAVTVKIASSQWQRVARNFTALSEEGGLPHLHAALSPVISIEDHFEVVRNLSLPAADSDARETVYHLQQFGRGNKLTVGTDDAHFPLGFERIRDQCLGLLNGEEWTCVSRKQRPKEFESVFSFGSTAMGDSRSESEQRNVSYEIY